MKEILPIRTARQGLFVVLEGADGSGKTTQFNLLKERLDAAGYLVEIFDFPRYDQPSSHFVKKYLNGDYGPASTIDPYTASIFYALDRYEAAPEIKKALDEGKVVISNRYVGSNMAHQGAKFDDPTLQRGFFLWEDGLEYHLMKIPRPDLNIYLRVPAEVSYELVANKAARQYTDKKRDEHESDITHLKKSVATYDTLCQLFPKDYTAVSCTRNGKLLSVEQINDKIWQLIKPRIESLQLARTTQSINPKQSADKPTTKSTHETVRLGKVSLVALAEISSFSDSAKLSVTLPPSKKSFSYYDLSEAEKTTAKLYSTWIDNLITLAPKSHKCQHLFPAAIFIHLAISADNSTFSKIFSRLRSHRLKELRKLSTKLEKFAPAVETEVLSTAAPELIADTIAKLRTKNMLSSDGSDILLLNAEPKNELDLSQEPANATYDRKISSLKQALSKNLINPVYKIKLRTSLAEIITIIEALPDFSGRIIINPNSAFKESDDAVMQNLLEAAKANRQELMEKLSKRGYDKYLPYTVLLGQIAEIELKLNLNQVKTLIAGKLVEPAEIIEKIFEFHPLISEHLSRTVSKSKNIKTTTSRVASKK